MVFKTSYQKRRNQHINQDNRGKTCKIIGCTNKARSRGLCLSCYNKLYGKK